MQFPKRFLILLGSTGLLFLGACSNGQEAATSSSSPATETTSSPAQGSQRLKPATETGAAQMSLNVPATPLSQGKNKLTLMTMMDTKAQPVDAKEVQVTLTMSAKEMDSMGMKGMGEGSAKTEVKPASSPGTYDIETTVPFAGNWQLKVDLKQAKPPASAVFNLAVK